MRVWRAVVAILLAAGALTGVASAARADELADARARASRAAAELNAAQGRAAELEADVAEQTRRLDEAEATLAALSDTLRETAIRTYVGAAADGGRQLVAGDDINRQVQMQALARFVTQGNADAVDEYRVMSEDAQQARAALDTALADQREAVASFVERRRTLDAELARLETLERQRREAAAAAAAARSRSPRRAAAPTGPIVTGDWICPVQGAVAFVDSWGAPRSGGRRHQGVDMMAARGTPTVAPVGGQVTHRGNATGGLSWHLLGDDGTYYYGTHLSAYANEGAGHVAAGTVIGYVGDTGNARGNPHLHFEIHPGNGAAVNPTPTVARYC